MMTCLGLYSAENIGRPFRLYSLSRRASRPGIAGEGRRSFHHYIANEDCPSPTGAAFPLPFCSILDL